MNMNTKSDQGSYMSHTVSLIAVRYVHMNYLHEKKLDFLDKNKKKSIREMLQNTLRDKIVYFLLALALFALGHMI